MAIVVDVVGIWVEVDEGRRSANNSGNPGGNGGAGDVDGEVDGAPIGSNGPSRALWPTIPPYLFKLANNWALRRSPSPGPN
jgi:hypothetical protein